jgi:hypothetical protein
MNERAELLRLVDELSEDQVLSALAVLRRHVRPEGATSWPPAFFAGAAGGGTSIADDADELLADGFGR